MLFSCPQLTSIYPPSVDVNPSVSSPARSGLTIQLDLSLVEAFSNSLRWAEPAHMAKQRRIICAFRQDNSSINDKPKQIVRGRLFAHSEASFIPGSNDATCSLPSITDLQILGSNLSEFKILIQISMQIWEYQ